jgi:hypothetical protein
MSGIASGMACGFDTASRRASTSSPAISRLVRQCQQATASG